MPVCSLKFLAVQTQIWRHRIPSFTCRAFLKWGYPQNIQNWSILRIETYGFVDPPFWETSMCHLHRSPLKGLSVSSYGRLILLAAFLF